MALLTTDIAPAPSSSITLMTPGANISSIPSNQTFDGPYQAIPAADKKIPSDDDVDQEKQRAQQKVESDAAWDAEPENPRNWSSWRKWKNVSLVSFYTFITPCASSMMAPGLPEIATRYNISNPTIVALTLSIYLLAFVFSPFLVGPLSEIYGRNWVLHLSNLFFMVFVLASVFAPTAGALIGFRFLAGLGGCTPVVIGGGSVSDMFDSRERGTAMSVFTMGPLVGPILGPTIGGVVSQSIGVQWVFVLLTIMAAAGALVGIPFLEETYAPVVKERLSKLRRNDVEPSEKAVVFEVLVKPALTQVLKENLSRPFILLTRSLICFMLSLYMALIYGYLYMMFTTFPNLFGGVYGWGPGISGLAYLGPGIGFMIASGIGARFISWTYITLSERNEGQGKPEFRIPVMFVGSVLVPIGLFWYGWSAEARLHWIMPIIGSAIFATGMMWVFIPCQLYLVDAFTYAASVLAAASVLRSLFGFVFPLFGEQMFAAMGFGGGNSLLAGMAIATGIPFPVWLYYRGETMRLSNPLNR